MSPAVLSTHDRSALGDCPVAGIKSLAILSPPLVSTQLGFCRRQHFVPSEVGLYGLVGSTCRDEGSADRSLPAWGNHTVSNVILLGQQAQR